MQHHVFSLSTASKASIRASERHNAIPERLPAGQPADFQLQQPSQRPIASPTYPLASRRALGELCHNQLNQRSSKKRGRPSRANVAARDTQNLPIDVEHEDTTIRPRKRLRKTIHLEQARNIKENETPSQLDRRRQEERYDRSHRARNRDIDRGHAVGSSPAALDTPRYVYCLECGIPKVPSRIFDGICIACCTGDHTDEQRFCLNCSQEKALLFFIDRGQIVSRCLDCRIVHFSRDHCRRQGEALADLLTRIKERDLQQPAVSEDYWRLTKLFYEKLATWKLESCERCNETGFDMKLDD